MYPQTKRIGGFDRCYSGGHGMCPYFLGPWFVLSQTIYTLNPINVEVKTICTYYWHDQTPISSKNFTKMICKDTNRGWRELEPPCQELGWLCSEVGGGTSEKEIINCENFLIYSHRDNLITFFDEKIYL